MKLIKIVFLNKKRIKLIELIDFEQKKKRKSKTEQE